jgi:D-sedoheptulose 7-phosphate isomerase
MDKAEQGARLAGVAAAAFERRRAAGLALVAAAEPIARACHAMARRFHRGGKLIAFGNGAASTDAQHVAVEFVHPVIVGKRALPALSLTNDVASLTGIAGHHGWDEVFAHQLRYLARPQDIALGISQDGRCRNVLRALEAAKALGLLTVALTGGASGPLASSAVDHRLAVPSEDPQVVKEVQVTIYHILWELVHIFFEQPGVLDLEER